MSLKAKYVCSECGREFDIEPHLMVCPDCSKLQQPNRPLRGILDVRFEGYPSDPRELLPIEREFLPNIPVGNTPLWRPERLRDRTGFENLYIKDDSLNPTGSLKDRASFLVAAFARKHNIAEITVASTGNAGSSMAGIGAASGLSITVFVPKNAPRAKLVQALQYGARVVRVEGNYDLAYDLSMEYSARNGSLSRNTAFNPLTIEGKKSAAIEIFLQLGHAPDAVFVPVGDGVILAGIYKGFADLISMGLMDGMPAIYAVQAEGSDAVCRAVERGDFGDPIPSSTTADSICVDVPRNGYRALAYLREYGGRCVRVSDGEILAAQHELASSAGVFAEPAAAAAYAGLLSSRDGLDRNAEIVILITGNGLKDIASAEKSIEFPEKTVSNIEELF
ncbi:threonine synthase [bacterium]|nr:threonine synthase [bacterium]